METVAHHLLSLLKIWNHQSEVLHFHAYLQGCMVIPKKQLHMSPSEPLESGWTSIQMR
ncbi:hypothetical protein HOLleu_08196 [Holothuria leucospilota]|uniref:Uncharacterized protein n=1 Tax=Holothuria leucospilota TaxID=206669 RepID=A0A9Q1CH46_HOLLE|nr:hypothetical protein HOLleu_08196 [Holothuria leucospilota]